MRVGLTIWYSVLLLAVFGVGQAQEPFADSPALTFVLSTNAQVDSEGIYLANLLVRDPCAFIPPIRISAAPAFGQTTWLQREQVQAAAVSAGVAMNASWAGADSVRITRRARMLTGQEVQDQLTVALQREQVRDRGELELKLLRAWIPISIPDEPYSINILDLPVTGVTTNFTVRFELKSARETFGPWEMVCGAHVWRSVWITRSSGKRKQLFAATGYIHERRDVLAFPAALAPETTPSGMLQFAQSENSTNSHKGPVNTGGSNDGDAEANSTQSAINTFLQTTRTTSFSTYGVGTENDQRKGWFTRLGEKVIPF